MLERYLDHVRDRKRTAYEIERVLRKHVVPAFGNMEIDQVRRRDVLAMFDAIERPYAANHALTYTSTFLNWCVDRGLIETNPAYGIKRTTRNPERSRERVLTDEELKTPWKASCSAKGFPAYYGQTVRLLMLTGARRNEVPSMHVDQLDTRLLPSKTVMKEPSGQPLTPPGATCDMPLKANTSTRRDKGINIPASSSSSRKPQTANGGHSKRLQHPSQWAQIGPLPQATRRSARPTKWAFARTNGCFRYRTILPPTGIDPANVATPKLAELHSDRAQLS